MDEQKHLNLDVANVVATAMKEWAIEKEQPILPIGSSPLPE